MTDGNSDIGTKVLLRFEGAIAYLRLSRPEVLNAIDDDSIAELDRHLAAIESSSARAVVLTGTGRAFCAGADLKALQADDGALDAGEIAGFIHAVGLVTRRLAQLPMPVIAAVNGIAVAGGLELLLACDIVIAAEDAMIGDAHANFGLIPGAGGSVHLPRIVGGTTAKYMLFTGKTFPAQSLVAHGLVSEVVGAEQLLLRATELARELAGKSPTALAALKRLVDEGLAQPIDAALALEAHANDAHCRTVDFSAGLRAFAEKRPPSFPDRDR